MSKIKISKVRFLAQKDAMSLKYNKLDPGTTIHFQELKEDTIVNSDREVPNDVIFGATEKGDSIKLPVREIIRMRTADGKSLIQSEADSNSIDFPTGVKIVESKDRKGRNDKIVYPIGSYLLVNDLMAGKIDYQELLDGGMKENNGGFEPVQDYIVEEI